MNLTTILMQNEVIRMTMTAQPALAIAGLQPPATQAHFLAVDLWALTKQDMTSLISQVST